MNVTFDPGFRPWIHASADGRRVVVALGRMYDTPGKRSLIEVDVAAGTAHPIEVEGNLEIHAVALSADGASAIAAVAANGAVFTDILDFCARVLAIRFGKARWIDER